MEEGISLNAEATSVTSSQRIAGSAGLITFACFVSYFMLMKYFNLLRVVELRAIDFLILGAGIFIAFRHYQLKTKRKMAYLQGLLFGLSISTFSVLPFALFTGVYFGWIDPLSVKILKDNAPVLGVYISPIKIAFATAFEGIASGMVITFVLMQYFKNDSPHKAISEEPNSTN